MDQRFDVEELVREARKAAKADKELLEAMEALSKRPEWERYVGVLNVKIQMFADQLLAPAGSVDGCVALEYVKGAMGGLVIARDTPAVIIAGKDQIRRAAAQVEDDDDA